MAFPQWRLACRAHGGGLLLRASRRVPYGEVDCVVLRLAAAWPPPAATSRLLAQVESPSGARSAVLLAELERAGIGELR